MQLLLLKKNYNCIVNKVQNNELKKYYTHINEIVIVFWFYKEILRKNTNFIVKI